MDFLGFKSLNIQKVHESSYGQDIYVIINVNVNVHKHFFFEHTKVCLVILHHIFM
jgi:hypothetical protein